MYKLLLWGLRVLFVISWLFSIAGTLPYGAVRPLVSVGILLAACYVVNLLFAKLYKVAANSESTNITALLLFFIFQPPKNVREGIALGLAGAIAIASKYVLVYRERHLFNPAAFGAVVIGLTGLLSSRWWIGRANMFIFAVILGYAIVRKIHRIPMAIAFGVTAVLLALIRGSSGSTDIVSLLQLSILSFPVVFFGTTMLTEPVTTPPHRYQQILYGVIVGLLFSSGLHFGDRTISPELALLIGNILVFAMAIRARQPLVLKERSEIGDTVFQYRFAPETPLSFKAGQYVELTLPLKKTDFRGNRRSFTIASSPTENDVLFGIKEPQPSSAFKSALAKLAASDVISANNLAGDFILPSDQKQKLVFIAGGIGVTPFRSMLKFLVDSKQQRNITLFYCVSDPKQIVYKDVLQEAEAIGLKVVYVLTLPPKTSAPVSWKGEVGFLTKEVIAKHALDYPERRFYISGPDVMVQANKKLLRSMGVKHNNIKTDYFSGY